MKMVMAEKEGKWAFQKGASLGGNPYKPRTWKHDSWNMGWRRGQELLEYSRRFPPSQQLA